MSQMVEELERCLVMDINVDINPMKIKIKKLKENAS